MRTSSTLPRNPYLEIVRRYYPEPLVALLAFILGIWLWDHYFGKSDGYEPGTEEMALIKIDRDLRLADAMAGDPVWLRWMAGAEKPSAARKIALESLMKLAEAKSIHEDGIIAYGMIEAVDKGIPVMDEVSRMKPDLPLLLQKLARYQGTWWDARVVAAWQGDEGALANWRVVDQERGQQLRKRALLARSAVWLIALAGFAFLPSTVRKMDAGLKAGPRGYAAAWTPALGLTIFLTAMLAWIGFGVVLNFGLSDGVPPLLATALDFVARLLPPLIALALLFRKPGHIVRVLGIDRRFHVGMVLGLFSLLTLLDQPLRLVFGNAGSTEPGGGLSLGEAGLSGLVMVIAAACVAAPIAEELLYRGILFPSLRNKLGVVMGALLSSLIFALLHIYDGYGLASVGIFGFCCALLYASTGSMTTVIFLHVLYNLSIKLPEWFVYQSPLG